MATLVLVGGLGCWYVHGGLTRASKLADFGLWTDVRGALDYYLILHPGDDRAHVLYAESLMKDLEGTDRNTAVTRALEHLGRVPDDAKLGAVARMEEGKIQFLGLEHPARAERAFRRALEIDPELTAAHQFLWVMYDQTGRSDLAEPFFRAAYEKTKGADRVYLLRDWCLTQFFPGALGSSLDQPITDAASDPKETSAPRRLALRLIRFRNAEPDAPLGYAALARWFHATKDLEFAIKTLDDGLGKMKGEEQDPFFLHTLIGIQVALGQFQEAEKAFERWPEPHEGYEYWLSRAKISHEVRNEFPEAAECYEKALATWPGPIDWLTRTRKAECLQRLGDDQHAAEERQTANQIKELLSDEAKARLWESLGLLDDPLRVYEIKNLYRKLGCAFEAEGWGAHLTELVAGGRLSPSNPKMTTKP